MTWSKGIRQLHRWLAVAFTAAIVGNLLALVAGSQAVWIGLVALFPLVLLLATGLYLFALPHAGRWRRRASRPAGERP